MYSLRLQFGFHPDCIVIIVVGIAQLVRAPDCGSGGRRFESVYPPHFNIKFSMVRAGRISGLTLAFWLCYNGMSPRGKAKDFDSFIRGFESRHPSQTFPGYSVLIQPNIIILYCYDPVAQSAEHLPFKQGVRSSNLRWVTTPEQSPLCSGAFLCSRTKKRHPPAPLLFLSRPQPLTLGRDLG